jgi:hypothetical protein
LNCGGVTGVDGAVSYVLTGVDVADEASRELLAGVEKTSLAADDLPSVEKSLFLSRTDEGGVLSVASLAGKLLVPGMEEDSAGDLFAVLLSPAAAAPSGTLTAGVVLEPLVSEAAAAARPDPVAAEPVDE